MSRSEQSETPATPAEDSRHYTVVARRYRPQAFDELIGQEHVARALGNAITTGRVGHAYLFTGARGVGKTSAARILAKALNCPTGPTPTPCNQCDICRSVTQGEDVDVLEIDGASNRGIDEIRQLRQNANVRPSRARFKIYIIDEVHMLTREAFNALLKTLEEPPGHVKFIFCTTEPAKIPITILSRCQRFDFAGIHTRAIAERLRQIVEMEGVEAEPEALETLARRASGSMRDSQSLLEQLLAFAPQRITVADVHGMLGTAADQCLVGLIEQLVAQNPAAALATLDEALGQGVDVGQLLEQLLGYLRDCMTAAAGCGSEAFLYSLPASAAQVSQSGKRLGLPAVLAAIQIVDQALARMRVSTQGRVLAELALVRISQLADLNELSEVIDQLRSGAIQSPREATAIAADAPKKNNEPLVVPHEEGVVAGASRRNLSPSQGDHDRPDSSSAAATPKTAEPGMRVPLTSHNAAEVWTAALATLSGMAADYGREFVRIAAPAPTRLVVTFRAGYAMAKSVCERPEQLAKFEQALAAMTGQKVQIEFTVDDPQREMPAAAPRPATAQQRMMEVMQNPLIRRAAELLGAQPVKIDDAAAKE
jgi:DNA polymerase-3 subunit gamma/tau